MTASGFARDGGGNASSIADRTLAESVTSAPAPLEQIQIQPVGTETLQTALTSGDRALGAGVVRIHLAYHEDAIAPVGDRGSHDFLGAAITVHFSGVDERHAEIDTETKGGNL